MFKLILKSISKFLKVSKLRKWKKLSRSYAFLFPFHLTLGNFIINDKIPNPIWFSINRISWIYVVRWVFFTFFKLYKWYQIAQRITYKKNNYNQKDNLTNLVKRFLNLVDRHCPNLPKSIPFIYVIKKMSVILSW